MMAPMRARLGLLFVVFFITAACKKDDPPPPPAPAPVASATAASSVDAPTPRFRDGGLGRRHRMRVNDAGEVEVGE